MIKGVRSKMLVTTPLHLWLLPSTCDSSPSFLPIASRHLWLLSSTCNLAVNTEAPWCPPPGTAPLHLWPPLIDPFYLWLIPSGYDPSLVGSPLPVVDALLLWSLLGRAVQALNYYLSEAVASKSLLAWRPTNIRLWSSSLMYTAENIQSICKTYPCKVMQVSKPYTCIYQSGWSRAWVHVQLSTR